jgi:UDP-N-acetylmuramyl pentapeptide synthase
LGSLEAITKAKFELLEVLPQEGRAFLNADDERLMAQKVIPPSQVVTFGIKQGADYRATGTRVDQELQQCFQVEGLGEFQIPTLGQHNVTNALAAIAVGRELGLAVPSIREALNSFSPSPMRMERVKFGEVIILNDAYNANPASMRAAIQVLVGLKSGGRKIAVLGDMLELGHQAPQAHLELGQFVAASSIDRLIAVGKLAEGIVQGALQEGFDSRMVDLCLDAGQAARRLKGMFQPGDVVLLKASRAMRLEEILPLISSPSSKG